MLVWRRRWTFSCTLLTQNLSIPPSSLFIWVNIPHVLSCQALIHQWEYQPIRRRVEKGAYYHLLNQADDKDNCLAGQPDLKPRVIAHRAHALLCTYPRCSAALPGLAQSAGRQRQMA